MSNSAQAIQWKLRNTGDLELQEPGGQEEKKNGRNGPGDHDLSDEADQGCIKSARATALDRKCE